jgi:hypothetical protein
MIAGYSGLQNAGSPIVSRRRSACEAQIVDLELRLLLSRLLRSESERRAHSEPASRSLSESNCVLLGAQIPNSLEECRTAASGAARRLHRLEIDD